MDDPTTRTDQQQPAAPTSENEPPIPVHLIETKAKDISTEDVQQPTKSAFHLWEAIIRKWNERREGEAAKWTDKAIVILTVGIVFLAFMQWLEMHEGGKQTDRIIAADERIAAAMEGAVTQAQKTFTATIQQAETAQRAWVYPLVHPASVEHFAAGTPFVIRVMFKNTGKTPALKLRAVTYRTPVLKSKSPNLSLPRPIYKTEDFVTMATLNPESMSYADLVLNLTPQDVDTINRLEGRQYVWGRIEYEDVFSTTHWVNWCTFLLPGGDFAICPEYNEMDNNRPRTTAN